MVKPVDQWTLEDELLEEAARCNADPRRPMTRYVALTRRLRGEATPLLAGAPPTRTRAELRTTIEARGPLPVTEARAFGYAWDSGDGVAIEAAGRALIVAAGEVVPEPAVVGDAHLREAERVNCVRSLALELYDALRPEAEGS